MMSRSSRERERKEVGGVAGAILDADVVGGGGVVGVG